MTTQKREPRRDAPIMAPYARHVLVCTGPYCADESTAQRIYRRLGQTLGELGDYANPVRVKRSITSCLGVCIGGPLVAVYPDGIWYHHVDEAALDRIVDEHLRHNCPVEELIFHRLEENHHLENNHRGDDNSTLTPD